MKCRVKDFGLIDYQIAYGIQKRYLSEIKLEGKSDMLMLCEHPSVFTIGRRGTRTNVLVGDDFLKERGVHLIWTDRGGDVTYHGPGQLVTYPIFDLRKKRKDILWYLYMLEEAGREFLKDCRINPQHKNGQRGIWVGDEKIASLGIGVSNWITYHGIAINIDMDLSFFSMIRPCGSDTRVTSVAKILDEPPSMSEAKRSLLDKFSEVFKLTLVH